MPKSRKPSTRGSKPAEKAPKPPAREELIARGLVLQIAWRGRATGPELEGPRVARAAAQSPVRSAVDRSMPLDVFSIDTEIKSDGHVIVVLRRPYGFPSGPMPGDPAGFSSQAYSRLGRVVP